MKILVQYWYFRKCNNFNTPILQVLQSGTPVVSFESRRHNTFRFTINRTPKIFRKFTRVFFYTLDLYTWKPRNLMGWNETILLHFNWSNLKLNQSKTWLLDQSKSYQKLSEGLNLKAKIQKLDNYLKLYDQYKKTFDRSLPT